MDKKLSALLKIIISVLLLTFLVIQIDINQVLEIFSNSNLIYLFASIILFIISLIISGFSLYMFFKSDIKLRKFFPIYLKAWAYGFTLPGKIGDFSISYFLRKDIKMGESNAYVLMNKLVSLAITLVFIIILSFKVPEFTFASQAVLIGAIILFALFVVTWKFKLKRVNKFLEKYTFGLLKGFRKTMFDSKKNKKKLFLSGIFSVIRYIFLTIMFLVIFLAFGYTVDFWILFVILLIVTIVSIIPISIGGTGVRENTFVILMSIVGYNAGISVSVILFVLFVKYFFVMAIIGVNMLKRD